jgi:hypothetical protein
MDGSNQQTRYEYGKNEMTSQGKKPKLKTFLTIGDANFCYGIIPLRTGEYPLRF